MSEITHELSKILTLGEYDGFALEGESGEIIKDWAKKEKPTKNALLYVLASLISRRNKRFFDDYSRRASNRGD